MDKAILIIEDEVGFREKYIQQIQSNFPSEKLSNDSQILSKYDGTRQDSLRIGKQNIVIIQADNINDGLDILKSSNQIIKTLIIDFRLPEKYEDIKLKKLDDEGAVNFCTEAHAKNLLDDKKLMFCTGEHDIFVGQKDKQNRYQWYDKLRPYGFWAKLDKTTGKHNQSINDKIDLIIDDLSESTEILELRNRFFNKFGTYFSQSDADQVLFDIIQLGIDIHKTTNKNELMDILPRLRPKYERVMKISNNRLENNLNKNRDSFAANFIKLTTEGQILKNEMIIKGRKCPKCDYVNTGYEEQCQGSQCDENIKNIEITKEPRNYDNNYKYNLFINLLRLLNVPQHEDTDNMKVLREIVNQDFLIHIFSQIEYFIDYLLLLDKKHLEFSQTKEGQEQHNINIARLTEKFNKSLDGNKK